MAYADYIKDNKALQEFAYWERNFTKGLVSMKSKEDVIYLQQILNDMDLTGNPLRINGVFNKRTQDGVKMLLEEVTDRDSSYINKILRKMKTNLTLNPSDIMKQIREA